VPAKPSRTPKPLNATSGISVSCLSSSESGVARFIALSHSELTIAQRQKIQTAERALE
jgi:hypothetical protein